MFTKVNHISTLYTGSLETDMGGHVNYGFDTSKGLLWLERNNHEKYAKVDAIWDEAENFLISSTRTSNITTPTLDITMPKTVTRSIVGYSTDDDNYTEFSLEEEHTGRSALKAFESDNDKIFASVDDNEMVLRANQLLQVGLEGDINGF